jgi:hypothetical protein
MLTRIRNRGGAFSSCSGCTLNSDTLDLTCTNCVTVAQSFQASTINLGKQKWFHAFAYLRRLTDEIDGTAKVDGHGVFVRDNGKLSCRAPTAA